MIIGIAYPSMHTIKALQMIALSSMKEVKKGGRRGSGLCSVYYQDIRGISP
jgi:hypothetical protein